MRRAGVPPTVASVNRVSAKRLAFRLWLGLLLLAGLGLRYAGLDEPVELHPDERNIARWMNRMQATGSLRPQTYAGGFFVLANVARSATEAFAQHAGHRWAYFIGKADRLNASPLDPVVFGRHFNVWLGTLSILLTAALARRIARSRAAALVAAALMAFAAFPIEHAHYLESDMAMLSTLLLALWALSRFLAMRRIRDWILAAVCCGFAAGTKFPLAVLILPLAVSVRAPLEHPRPARRIALLLALAAGGAWLGFVAATPDALHRQEFRAGLAKACAAVFAETAEILGPAAGAPFARQHMNAANLTRFAGTLRLGWLLLAAAGLPLCFARRFRPFWPVAILFPVALSAYVVFLAPWSRSQEFMALLPNLAVLAALPVAALWQARARAAKGGALVLAAAAVLPVAQTGVAVSSQFAWDDTRRLANRALSACFPTEQPLAAERYAAPAEAGLTSRVWPMSEYAAEASRAHNPLAVPDYLLLNVDFHSRGLCDPRTLELFPPFAENKAALRADGMRIAAWSALASPAPQPYFRAPRIELWHRRAGALPVADLGVELPRPTLVADEGRTSFFPHDLRAGPRRALLVDKHPREIAIGGPGDFEGPVFLVFRTHERAAVVRTDGFGRTAQLALGPYDSGVIALERPWWNPRWARFERVVVRAETGGPTFTYLPCFLLVAFSPLEAATLILDDGHPEKAVALLRENGVLTAAGPFWQALAGEPAAAEPAQAMLARWDEWLARDANDPPPAACAGLPLAIWQDFARIRLVPLKDPVLLGLPPSPDGIHAERRTLPLATLLPVAGANQRLDLDLGRSPDAFGNTNFSGTAFLDLDDGTCIGRSAFLDLPDPRGNNPSISHSNDRFSRLMSIAFRASSGGTVCVNRAEFSWNWRDMLALRAAQLRRALAPAPAPAAFRYGDWLAVRSCQVANGQVALELEALQDDVPPLVAQTQIFRHRKWHARETVPLGNDRDWLRGDRRTVQIPLAADDEPSRIGIALLTDVPWHASVLPLAGAPEAHPFPTLAELLGAP